MRCNGCGGRVGRDCYNPQECEWITRDQAARYAAIQYDPEPCQGCSMVIDGMTSCIGLCDGLACDADVDARRTAFQNIKTITAATIQGPEAVS